MMRSSHISRLSTSGNTISTILRSPFLISITGGTGSGKTTLAMALMHKFTQGGACLLEQDSYYLDRSHLSVDERAAINFDDPDALENNLLLSHLEALVNGKPIEKPVYCFKTHTRTHEVQILHPTPVILFEGLFALRDPRIRRLADLKIYVEADADIRFIRRARRDVFDRGRTMESVTNQYLSSVRPMHELHIEPAKSYADLVVQNNGAVAEFQAEIENTFSRALQRMKVKRESSSKRSTLNRTNTHDSFVSRSHGIVRTTRK